MAYKIGKTIYTDQEVDQARRLIFKGKAYATQGDPRLSRLVQKLQDRGYLSAGALQSARLEAIKEAKAEAQGFMSSPEQIQYEVKTTKGGDVLVAKGVTSSEFSQSLPTKVYQQKLNNKYENYPLVKDFNPKTQKVYDQPQRLKANQPLFSKETTRVYVNPKTNKPIYDIEAYSKKYNIKLNEIKPYGNKPSEYARAIKEGSQKTTDIKNIPERYIDKSFQSGTIQPITSGDITAVALGVGGFVKGGAKIGTQILLSKPITQVTSKTIDVIIPPKDTSFALGGIPSQVGRGTLFLASTPLTAVAFGKEIGESALTKPIQTTKELGKFAIQRPYEFGTILRGEYAYAKAEQLFLKKSQLKESTPSFEQSVKPNSRQRATLLLKNIEGEYIFGKTRSGDIISIGGKIEKGQTPKQAIFAELKQETGLKKSDIKNLEYKGEVITPEETFFTFTGELKKGQTIKASSDLKEIITVKQAEISKYIGQTPKYPVSIPKYKLGTQQYALEFPKEIKFKLPTIKKIGNLRSYETGLVKFAETGIKPKLLKIDTKLGEYYLGTQSRYDVAGKTQLKYLETGDLLLASGTQEPLAFSRLGFKSKGQVKATKSQRGAVEGLYVQPPVSPSIPRDVMKLEGYSGKGKLVSNIKDLPIKVPETQAGYVGLSYVGIFGKKPIESLGFKIGKSKPTILIAKEKPSTLSVTPKTLKGQESELIYDVGKYIETKGRAKRYSIGGKKVFVQQVQAVKDISKIIKINKLIKEGKFGKVKELTGADYSTKNYRYIPEETFISPKKYKSSETIKVNLKEYSKPIYKESKSILPRERKVEYGKETKRELETYSIPKESIKESYQEPNKILKETYKPYKPIKEKTIKYYEYPKLTTDKFPKPSIYSRKKKSKSLIKYEKTYTAFIKRKGKFKSIGSDLTKGEAGRLISKRLLQELSRTGKIKATGRKKEVLKTPFDFKPREDIFRTYKVRKGRKVQLADTFIQKASANLQTKQEQAQLKQARRIKQLINM